MASELTTKQKQDAIQAEFERLRNRRDGRRATAGNLFICADDETPPAWRLPAEQAITDGQPRA